MWEWWRELGGQTVRLTDWWGLELGGKSDPGSSAQQISDRVRDSRNESVNLEEAKIDAMRHQSLGRPAANALARTLDATFNRDLEGSKRWERHFLYRSSLRWLASFHHSRMFHRTHGIELIFRLSLTGSMTSLTMTTLLSLSICREISGALLSEQRLFQCTDHSPPII